MILELNNQKIIQNTSVLVEYTSKFTVIIVNIKKLHTLNASVGSVESKHRKTLYGHECYWWEFHRAIV